MQRQALNDFAELEAARTAWKKTRDRQYLELMVAQSARILGEIRRWPSRLACTRAGIRGFRGASWALSAKGPLAPPLPKRFDER